MELPATIFRAYDIRGIVGDQLRPEVARAVGLAYAALGWERLGRAPRLAVGRDNRPSGAALADAVAAGIAAGGGQAVELGELPTPALYFATHVLDVDGGLQVTGSHNPPEFNGFKLVLGGDPVYGAALQDLHRRIAEGRTPARPGGARRRDPSVLARYRQAIVERHGRLSRPLKVVVDCGNGVASLVAAENLRDLQAAVPREGAELGIAFDGDGDRIGAVDERGRPVFGDQLLLLLGRDLARRAGPGHTVIFDVKCSDILPQELERAGLRPLMWKTGHSLIKQKMRETGAALAGEMSGHMFFGDGWYGCDDALVAAARLLGAVADQGGPLSRLLADLPATVATPELRVPCGDERKFAIVERAARHFAARYPVTTLDGVRIRFPHGWGLLRASNTQPALVLRFEASTPAALAAQRAEVEEWLAAQGVPG